MSCILFGNIGSPSVSTMVQLAFYFYALFCVVYKNFARPFQNLPNQNGSRFQRLNQRFLVKAAFSFIFGYISVWFPVQTAQFSHFTIYYFSMGEPLWTKKKICQLQQFYVIKVVGFFKKNLLIIVCMLSYTLSYTIQLKSCFDNQNMISIIIVKFFSQL